MGFRPIRQGAPLGGLYLPGVSGNYAHTPDAAELNVAGDIDIRVHVALADWTPAATQTLLAKYGSAGWLFRVGTDGRLSFTFRESTDTLTLSRQSSVAPTIENGARLWVRVTLDSDNGAGGHTVTFYTSLDGDTWTVLGAPVVNSTPRTILGTSAKLTVGSRDDGSTENAVGTFYAAEVRDGIDGTIVAAPKFVSPATKFTSDGTTYHDGHRLWTLAGTRWEWRV